MSPKPTVILKPIGLKLRAALSTESRQPAKKDKENGKNDKYENLFSDKVFLSVSFTP